MSKYTKDQLKQMATETLKAKESNDPRYNFLLMQMMMLTNLSAEAVEFKIKELAEKGETL